MPVAVEGGGGGKPAGNPGVHFMEFPDRFALTSAHKSLQQLARTPAWNKRLPNTCLMPVFFVP